MAITTLNISLPEELRRLLDDEVARGGYGSASEYVRDALRAALHRRAVERLEILALEGLATPDRVMDAAAWDDLRRRARKADRTARR